MEDYLTIGEVARVKKVSTKALRYYEKIGILIPAKIDPVTGYRYYKNEQMLAVDMIRFFQILDIPLKNWHFYVDEQGQFDLKRLIDDGQKRADEKIRELQICMNRLKLASRGLKDAETFMECDRIYRRRIERRNILREKLDAGAPSVEFHEKLSMLFDLAREHHLSANYPSGMVAESSPEGVSYYVYLEVYEECKQLPQYMFISEGEYECLRCPPQSIFKAQQLYPRWFAKYPGFVLVEADCISSPLHFQSYPVELQFIVDKSSR